MLDKVYLVSLRWQTFEKEDNNLSTLVYDNLFSKKISDKKNP